MPAADCRKMGCPRFNSRRLGVGCRWCKSKELPLTNLYLIRIVEYRHPPTDTAIALSRRVRSRRRLPLGLPLGCWRSRRPLLTVRGASEAGDALIKAAPRRGSLWAVGRWLTLGIDAFGGTPMNR